MRDYDSDQPLISLHIPKCAGTSFKRVLAKWYGKKLKLHYFNEQDGKPPIKYRIHRRLPRGRLRPGICIHGHFNRKRGFGAEDYYPDVRQYITILRDPFEVHLSNYFHARSRAEMCHRDGKQHWIITDDIALEQYLEERPTSFLNQFFPASLTLENFESVLEKRFIYIGVAEDLQRSVERLAEKLGFPSVNVPFANASPRTELVPNGARESFKERNPLAFAIYDYARSTYDS